MKKKTLCFNNLLLYCITNINDMISFDFIYIWWTCCRIWNCVTLSYNYIWQFNFGLISGSTDENTIIMYRVWIRNLWIAKYQIKNNFWGSILLDFLCFWESGLTAVCEKKIIFFNNLLLHCITNNNDMISSDKEIELLWVTIIYGNLILD